MDSREWRGLAGFVTLVVAVAAIASVPTVRAPAVYGSLQGPTWAPPAWLFAPVWTLLYAMIAVSGWLAWKNGASLRGPAMRAFGAQLALNGAWAPLFFALGWRGVALVDILLLDAAIVATIVLFARRDRLAAYLLVPYLLWSCFATALNAAYWTLNR